MVEAEDLAQLRLLNLELLRQLWVGQDAVRRSVTRAALEVRACLGNPRGSGYLTSGQHPGFWAHLVQHPHFTDDGILRAGEGRDWPWSLLRPEQDEDTGLGTWRRTRGYVLAATPWVTPPLSPVKPGIQQLQFRDSIDPRDVLNFLEHLLPTGPVSCVELTRCLPRGPP